MDYYSALKRSELLMHATIWINLEDSMPTEVSHTHNDKYDMMPFICDSLEY